jgi:molecular chaperone GrpE
MIDKKAKEKDEVKIEVSHAETEAQDESDNRDEQESGKAKSLDRMSKAELREKIEELQEKAEKDHDQFLRSRAEIDNIIKRNKKDKEEWIKYSNETLIKEILPVIDNLEKALTHSKDENSLQALQEGIELTLKGLKDTLAKSGLERVKSEGEPFDPCFHHAVSEVEHEDIEAGIILNELQTGYTLNQRLIRPAMVVLSKGKPGDKDSYDEKAPERICENK